MLSFIYAPPPLFGLTGQSWPPPLLGGYFQQSDYHRMEAGSLMNSRRDYPQDALRAVSDSYFTGLAMHGGDGIAYQQAMRRARPIIAQWSEWEQQTRNPAWR